MDCNFHFPVSTTYYYVEKKSYILSEFNVNAQGLQSLNLSFNILIGRIPENIGDMRSLESINFSVNQHSSQVPKSMSSLTFLSHLNLSNNNLIGRIPSGTQLQSFNESNFFGNKLC